MSELPVSATTALATELHNSISLILFLFTILKNIIVANKVNPCYDKFIITIGRKLIDMEKIIFHTLRSSLVILAVIFTIYIASTDSERKQKLIESISCFAIAFILDALLSFAYTSNFLF